MEGIIILDEGQRSSMLLVNKEQYEFIKNKDNYISKDKIKDEVEYIRFMVDDDNKSSEIVKEVNLYLDLFLQELLQERGE